jgi:ankyrin repeat protein
VFRKRDRDEADVVQVEEKEAKVDEEQTDNVLLDACRSGSLSDIEAALTGGASINATTAKGATELSLACEREDWELALPIVKLLLAKRFAPSIMNQNGWNGLHFAARLSSAEVVGLLLGKMRTTITFSPILDILLWRCIAFDMTRKQ